MAKKGFKNLKMKVSVKELENFLNIVKELNKISITHKLKWENGKIIFYSVRGEDETEEKIKSQGKIKQVKAFYYEKKKLFNDIPDDLNLTYVIKDGKKYAQKFDFLMKNLDEGEDYFDFTINYNAETLEVYNFTGKNSIMEIRAIGGDIDIVKDFPIDVYKERLEPSAAEYSFPIRVDNLEDAIKLSKFDKDNDVIELSIEKGQVKFSEPQWDLVVHIDENLPDGSWIFRKEYLPTIMCHKDYDHVTFSVFPSYLAVDEHKSRMLFSLELVD